MTVHRLLGLADPAAGTRLGRADEAVLAHQSAFYRRLRPDSLGRSLVVGAGRSLYPLMLATGASRLVHALEPSTAAAELLLERLTTAEPGWLRLYERCRSLDPGLPRTLSAALARVWVERGDVRTMQVRGYDLVSLTLRAEHDDAEPAELGALCRALVQAVRPGGLLVASFTVTAPGSAAPRSRGGVVQSVGPEEVIAQLGPYVDDLTVRTEPAERFRTDGSERGAGPAVTLLTARRTAGPNPAR